MSYYKRSDLINNLKGLTKFKELSFNGHSSIIISEYGGRPLGFFPKNNDFSLLWINPKINEAIKSKRRDIGGDRYWISPEREYFYKDPENWSGWFCPENLDPANYEIIADTDTACTLSSPISVQNMRTKDIYNGEVTRQISLIKENIKTGIKNYCGIEYIDDCVLYKPNLKINGWSLACIISGGIKNPGTVLVPTKSNPKPLSYFRAIPKNRLVIGENYIGFKIDVNDIYKLAVRPEDIDYSKFAKIGYILKMPASEEYGFIIKMSNDIPKTQKECFDISRDHPECEIGVIQSYNSESPEKDVLKYGEIEIQLNQFETIDNTSHGKAKHQLFGYIGTKDDILRVIEKYLGISNPTLF